MTVTKEIKGEYINWYPTYGGSVTIPGATKIHVKVHYGLPGATGSSMSRLLVYAGKSSNGTSAFSQYNFTRNANKRNLIKELDIEGDSVYIEQKLSDFMTSDDIFTATVTGVSADYGHEYQPNANFTGLIYNEEKTRDATDDDTLTLYARWAPDSSSYTIHYDANGGTGTMNDQTLDIGTEHQLKANTYKKEGYAFRRWNTKADGGGTSYNNEQAVKDLASSGSNVTLYAQWATFSDITIYNHVTGNLGDATKKFIFTASLSGLDVNRTYQTSDGTTFTADSNGNATYRFTLKAKDSLTLKDIPIGSTFTVTEEANNHDIMLTSNYDDSKQAFKGNRLSTDQHTLEANKNATMTFTNNRVQAAITGISMKYPIALIIMIVSYISILVIFGLVKRKSMSDD